MRNISLDIGRHKRLTDGLYIAGIAAVIAVCYELFYRMCTRYNGKYRSDFEWYIGLLDSDYKEKHRLIGWALDIMNRAGISLKGIVLSFAIVIGCLILANFIYLLFFTRESSVKRAVPQLLSALMLFMGPIYVPGFHEYFYRWSFQTFAWHSPTEQAMVLFAVLATVCFIKMYESSDEKVEWRWWVASAVMIFLSAFSKPAFAIDMMFACVALFLIDLFLPGEERFADKFKKRFIMGLCLVPSALYMIIIVKYNFNGEDELQQASVNITIEHLLDYPNLFGAIICGIAFPLVVWAVNIGLLREKRYRTVFIIFLMGVLQWSIFREGGERESHGNFAWGRQVGTYIFFLTSLAIAVNNWKDDGFMKDRPLARKAYFIILGCLLLLHAFSQLIYFYKICRGHSYLC